MSGSGVRKQGTIPRFRNPAAAHGRTHSSDRAGGRAVQYAVPFEEDMSPDLITY